MLRARAGLKGVLVLRELQVGELFMYPSQGLLVLVSCVLPVFTLTRVKMVLLAWATYQ